MDVSSFPKPIRVAVAVQKRYGDDKAGYLAAVMTYYGFFSLFPLMLLALAALGYVLAGRPELQQQLADNVTSAVPGLGGFVEDNVDAVVRGRGLAALIGAVGLFWTGTGVTKAAGYALGRIYRVDDFRAFWKRYGWAIGATIALGLLALLGFALVAFASQIDLPGALGPVARAAGVALGFAVDFALFLFAYRILTKHEGPSFSMLWPGALLGAVAWTALKYLGSWYVARTVSQASEVYGTFATTIGLLVLLYLAARVFLYGAELNAVLEERSGHTMGDRKPEQRLRAVEGAKRADPSAQSTAELVKNIASDGTTLVRKEIQLARQELMESVLTRAKLASSLIVAGTMALVSLIVLSLAAAAGLANVMPGWASLLVVAGVLLALAGVAAAIGIRGMKKTSMVPEETRRTIKEDVEWARAQLKR